MCGIGGVFFSERSIEVRAAAIRALNRAQLHRGPDGSHVAEKNGNFLCHQLLAMRLGPGTRQPITDAAGRYVLVYNGEIYNEDELKNNLKGDWHFHGHSDTEVLLYHLIEHGAAGVGAIDGMFAFGFYDAVADTLMLGRDAAGVKPLFYSRRTGGELMFASEIKGLIAAGISSQINPAYLPLYFLTPYFSCPEWQPFAGISEVPAGTVCTFYRHQPHQVHRFFDTATTVSSGSEQSYVHQLHETLSHGIQVSYKSDVPLGLFLSGGLDSGILLGVGQRQNQYAFTVRFPEHTAQMFDAGSIVHSDDLPVARRMARQYNVPHICASIAQTDYPHLLEGILKSNDIIPAWEQEMTQMHLSSVAAGYVKGVLVGDAADEFCYGYYFLLQNQTLHSLAHLLEYFHFSRRLLFVKQEKREQIKAQVMQHYTDYLLSKGLAFDEEWSNNRLAANALIRHCWLPRLLYNGDIHTMRYGLEARVPFANISVLRLTQSYNPAPDIAQATEKYQLRKAFEHVLPAELVARKKSAMPRDPRLAPLYTHMLRAELEDVPELIAQTFDVEEMRNSIKKDYFSDNERMILFNLLMMIQWVKSYS